MSDVLDSAFVAVSTGHRGYSNVPPFSPANAWPEYPFTKSELSPAENPAYEGVRTALQLLRLDEKRFGSPHWNPLREIVQPGDTVVLKPNTVREYRDSSPDHADCLITHGSIMRAVLDYVFIAVKGRGRIIIADAPQNDADFLAIRRISGLDDIQGFYGRYTDFNVEVYDLRPERADKIDGVIVAHRPLPGDPFGYVKVNLGMHSALADVNHLCHLLYGSEYDTGELHRHHHGDVHEYLISRTILDADCVISLPKLKTHKKVGLTVNMKNLVGINGNKNWLPHYREGTPAQGGDQFPDDRLRYRLERSLVDGFKRVFPLLGPLRPLVARPIKALGKGLFGDTNNGTLRSGNWHGNDTTWRMVLDLNRILMYAGSDGVLHDRPVRRFFSVVDGVVAGQGNGPLDPAPMPAGVILAGANPVAVDLACARLMGFDYRRLPVLCRALADHALPLVSFGVNDVVSRSNKDCFDRPLTHFRGSAFAFEPHFGWKGRVELREQSHETDALA